MKLPIRPFIFLALLSLAFLGTPNAFAATQQAHVSKNWAGFGASGKVYTGVRATWVVPTSKAVGKKFSADAEWVGIGGSETKDLIQVGTQTIFINGKAKYQAWYETLPEVQRLLPIDIHPGDTVSVSLKETLPGTWHLSFVNVTTGKSYTADIPYTSSHSSAEWIIERPLAITTGGTSYLALANFNTLTFTEAYATVNGVEVPLENANAEPILMSPTSTSVAAAPGTSAGASFTISYFSNSRGRAYLKAFRKVYKERSVLSQPSQVPAQTSSSPAEGTTVIRIFF